MSEKIRFRASKTGSFKLPPEGTYDLQIVKVETDKTSKDGEPQVVVTFEIADGEQAGLKFKQFYTLNEERGWLFRVLCEVAGLALENQNEDPDDDLAEFDMDPDDLLERYIRATVLINKVGEKKYVNLRDEQASTFQGASEGDSDGDEEEPADEPPANAGTSSSAPSGNPAGRRRRAPPQSA